MQTNEIKFIQVTPSELTELIRDGIRKELQAHEASKGKKEVQEELLTTDEAAQMLRVSKGTVLNITKRGGLKTYGVGRRVFYKKSEVQKALIKLQED